MDDYVNGSVWQADWPFCHTAMLQYLDDGKFCLLDYEEEARHGGTAFCIITDPDGSGKWQYELFELPERLKHWHRIQGAVFVLQKR